MEFLQYIKKNQFIILYCFCILLCFISAFIGNVGSYIMIAIMVLAAIFYDINKALILWLVNIFFYQTVGKEIMLLLFIICFISVVKSLIKKEIKLDKSLLIPMILSTLICLLGFFINFDFNNIHLAYSYINIIYTAFLLFLLRTQIDVYKIIKYASIALIVSCFLSLVFLFIKSDIEIFSVDSENLKRFKGLTDHENILSIYISSMISFNLFTFFKFSQNKILTVSIISVLFIFGILTLSKLFFILMIVLLVLYIIQSFKIYKTKALFQFIGIILVLCIFIFIFRDKISNIIRRFILYYNADEFSFLDRISTGRSLIWKEYLMLWSENVITIIFGIGLTTPVNNFSHNIMVDLLTKQGILGLCLVIFLIVYYVYQIRPKKITFINLIPIIILFISAMIDHFVYSPIIMLFIATMCLFVKDDNDKTNEVVVGEVKNDS